MLLLECSSKRWRILSHRLEVYQRIAASLFKNPRVHFEDKKVLHMKLSNFQVIQDNQENYDETAKLLARMTILLGIRDVRQIMKRYPDLSRQNPLQEGLCLQKWRGQYFFEKHMADIPLLKKYMDYGVRI